MNWFETHFRQALDSRSGLFWQDSYLAEPVLLALAAAGLFLLFRRSVGGRAAAASLIAGLLASELGLFDLIFPSLDAALGALGIATGTVNADVMAILTALTVGLALLALAARRRTRSLDRLATGAALAVICSTLWLYHLMFVNGAMMYELGAFESRAMRIARLPDSELGPVCRALGHECHAGPADSRPRHDNPVIERQFASHHGWYRAQAGPGAALAFSDSSALALGGTPYAYGYVERDGRYRWVIDRAGPAVLFRAHKALLFVFANLMTLAWGALAVAVMGGHRVMFARRRRQPARSRAPAATRTQPPDAQPPDAQPPSPDGVTMGASGWKAWKAKAKSTK